MNIAALFPARPVAVDCVGDRDACAARLARALAADDPANFFVRRVRGVATATAVNLWVSLRARPGRLAPQLFAHWTQSGGRTRLVGEIRQAPGAALRVAAAGVLLALMLLWMAARGDLAWPFAVALGAGLAAYPWLAWYVAGGDVAKIEAFLSEQLAAGTDDP